MLHVSELFIYPIKSLGGASVPAASVTDRGFQYDRRWMLIDEKCRFFSQRELPEMALLTVSISEGSLLVCHKKHRDAKLMIPLRVESDVMLPVTIWDDICPAQRVSQEADEWFSDMLLTRCRLVYMPDQSRRLVNTDYASHQEINSFSDAYPFMILGQASLDDLNSRLREPLPMNRFRPNIVFTGGTPYLEDQMKHFEIGPIRFSGVKLSERCVITTIDQDKASRGKEPLTTLSKYRAKGNSVHLGQNLLHTGHGEVKTGDPIVIFDQA